MQRLIPVLYLLTLASPARAGPPRLFVQDIEPRGVNEKVAKSLSGLLELELERSGLYEVVSLDDLRSMLRVEQTRVLLGDDEGYQERLGEIAKKVSAPYALASSVGQVGGTYVLSLRLLDVSRAEVVRRVNQTLVGREQDLIGSLRSAVLALTIEEKGIAPDISEQLIDDLKIAEKPKTFFGSLSFGFGVDTGWNTSGGKGGLLVFRPFMYSLRLDGEMPVLPWLRVFGSLGVGTSFAAHQQKDDNHLAAVYDAEDDEKIAWDLQAAQTQIDYAALRLPVELGVKVTPATGRFLPFALLGLGVAWQRYDLSSSRLVLFSERRESDDVQRCVPPFAASAESGGFCALDLEMQPRGDVSFWGLSVIAAAGAEWLFTHHLGLKLEVRWRYTYAFDSEQALRMQLDGTTGTYNAGTPADPDQRYNRYTEDTAVQQHLMVLTFSAGAVAYW
ncbi:MAG: hypothetical protein JXR96_26090 [Deltaproteobacteria bacterium]|nr:hypothetical protein [Deltaproteobacteria bacterium]